MAEQNAASLNVRLYFAGDQKFITPISVGDLPMGTEGRIDAVIAKRKVKIPDNMREIGELEIVMPIGLQGQNSEYDYIYNLSQKTKTQDVYYQMIDLEDFVHLEWRLIMTKVTIGALVGTDHSSKAQTRHNFVLAPNDIKRVR